MLLTIHNLPIRTQYSDVKELIIEKCGLTDSILDNLQHEGSGMRVTVGVSEEEDAALLVRKINGLYFGGQQLYVEDKRQKRELEQPYHTNMPQQQYSQAQAKPVYEFSQTQAVGSWQNNQSLPYYMYQSQLASQAVQSAYMSHGQQQYTETLKPQYSGASEQTQQGYNQLGYDDLQGYNQLGYDDQQGYNQQEYDDQLGYSKQGYSNQQSYSAAQSENLFARRVDPPLKDEIRSKGPWGETRSPSNDRRRPISPPRSNWGRETQPEPKRPRLDQRSERPDGSIGWQDRSYEQRGQSPILRGGRPDERPKITPNRWDRPNERDRRPEKRDPRDQPARQSRTEPEPSWKQQSPTLSKAMLDAIKTKAMRVVMYDTVRNLHAEKSLEGPSKLKTGLRKAIIARIEDDKGIGTKVLKYEDIVSRYRNKYPETSDFNMFYNLKKIIAEDDTLTGEGMKDIVYKFVSREQPTNPPKQPSNPPKQPSNPPKQPSNPPRYPGNAPRGPSNAPRYPGNAPRGPSNAPRGPSNAPRGPSNAPRGPSNVPRHLDNTPRYPNNSPRYPSNAPRYPSIAPRQPSNPTRWSAPETAALSDSKFPTNREVRDCAVTILRIIMFETAKNLSLESKLAQPSLMKSLLRKTLLERITDIVKSGSVPPARVREDYRKKYPLNGDAELYAKITKIIAEKGTMNTGEIKRFAVSCVYEQKANMLKFKPPGGATSNKPVAVTSNKPVAVTSNKPVAATDAKEPQLNLPPKIPNYPQGDKKIHSKLKKQNIQELEILESYQLPPNFQAAMNDEVNAIGAMMTEIFENPNGKVERSVFGTINKEVCVSQCMKFLSYHISKRVTDSGVKLARIYGHPRHPKREYIQSFLAQYNCVSLKKSVKAPFYTASFESYATVDELCNMGHIMIDNDNAIKFEQMHVAPKKPKYSQAHWKSRRKRDINSLIDYSRVKLLEKDWPAQEEAEKKSRAKIQAQESEEVVCVEEKIKTVDLTAEDGTKNVDDSNVTSEQSFLHEDFKVIDEVRESDNGDDDDTERKENVQVSDDWDQTGEDWDTIDDANVDGGNKDTAGDESTAGDDNTAKDGNNIAVKDKEPGSDENTAGYDKNITMDDDGTGGGEYETGNGKNTDESDENSEHGEDIGENVDDIRIEDLDWDNVDEDDLEDY